MVWNLEYSKFYKMQMPLFYLTILVFKSLNTGAIPNHWKTAHFVTIYKSGPKYNSENYMSISLTCISWNHIEIREDWVDQDSDIYFHWKSISCVATKQLAICSEGLTLLLFVTSTNVVYTCNVKGAATIDAYTNTLNNISDTHVVCFFGKEIRKPPSSRK